jgi:ATP-binding cassette subfamily F protein 3
MLLRPSNVLLLDEPTNHLDLDSKEVLLDALVDYGGTLIFVSHDRYFVERLATKIIEIGHGDATVYPGTYTEFLWHKDHPQADKPAAPQASGVTPHTRVKADKAGRVPAAAAARDVTPPAAGSHEEKKRVDALARKRQRATQARQTEIEGLEARIAECEATVRAIEQTMTAPGFYENRTTAQPVIDQHQALMWKVGELMSRWEELQASSDTANG